MNLDDVLAKLGAQSPEQQKATIDAASAALGDRKFIPSPGPQTDAYFSKADVLLYGGAGGGGKSSLIAGLALQEHRKSLLVRRQFTELTPLISELLKRNGTSEGFREAPTPRLKTSDGREIQLGGVQGPDDWKKYQGAEKDFLGVDEAAHFLRSQVDMLMGWVRSSSPGQRTRTVLATNPPLTSEGDWLIAMFRPWLDITHPNPAKKGELRWFVTNPDGDEVEVDGPEPVEFPGADRPTYPLSRTFIPSMLKDNPFLIHDKQYQAVQDSMGEPARSAIRDGNFMLARVDHEYQVIPTQWIRDAQARWTSSPPEHAPMTTLACDIAQGGADTTTIVARYDGWFTKIDQFPGVDTPTGNEVAGLIVGKRRNGCVIIIDMGGGYGGATKMRLNDSGIDVVPYKGASGTGRRTKDQQYGFYNKRSEAYWRMREALDPSQDGGSPIALPDDPELVSDLTAPHFETTARGVKITTKEKVVDALGRSPDKGDAVVMANFAGPKLQTHGNKWRDYAKNTGPGRTVNVKLGRQAARRNRK